MKSTQLPSTLRVMYIEEFSAAIGLSIPSVRRLIRQARRGEGDIRIPLPISPPGAKCRWVEADVLAFLTQSTRAPPVTPTVADATMRKQRDDDYAMRQERAKNVLLLHAAGRKSGRTE